MSSETPVTQAEPFVGPRSIQRTEKLYGRDDEIQVLTSRLLASHVMLLHSLSGAGKTSLINAGLIPELETNHHFRSMPVSRVHLLPDLKGLNDDERAKSNRYCLSVLFSMESELVKNNIISKEEMLPTADLAGMSLEDYLNLRKSAVTTSSNGKNAPRRTLLVLDQFEEILTLNPRDKDEKAAFFTWLMPILYDVSYWVLFSMRDDYVGGLEPYMVYIPNRLNTRFRLEFLNHENAIKAVRSPTKQLFDVTFEEDAAKQLVDNLRTISIPGGEGEQAKTELGMYVEPIQLQVVCLKLWRSRADPTRITLNDVIGSGNVDDALREYFNDVLFSIAGDDAVRQRWLRDWIQNKLIVEDSFRFYSHPRHLVEYHVGPDQLEQLGKAYLVRSEDRQGVKFYELTHDRLVKPIVEANRRWRDASLKLWQVNAERWYRDGQRSKSDLLLNDSASLEAARTGFNPSQGSPIDLAYLLASEQAILEAQEAAMQAQEADRLRLMNPERLLRVQLGTNLEEVGWGVIFHQDAPPELQEALKELIDLRRSQAGKNQANYFRIFSGINGYRPDDTAETFLQRNGETGGPTNPEKVPYYLLIVGGPESIPFQFQYDLDQRYAVGRIYFQQLEQYQSYARSVRVCEGGTVSLPNSAAIFATRYDEDEATRQVSNYFVEPLYEQLQRSQVNWQVREPVTGPQASLQTLSRLLGGSETPSLLVVDSWGAGMPFPPARLQDLGAILTSDWPGPARWEGPLRSEHYFSGGNVDDSGRLLGLVAVLFGSYTAGVPVPGDFHFLKEPEQAVDQPMLAELPQRLLGHPRGGALAVIAHVDKIWTSSFFNSRGESDISIYVGLFGRLMQGYTVGAAMELLNQRFASESTQATQLLMDAFFNPQPANRRRTQNTIVRAVDARNYLLIGDPAVRLPINPNQPYRDPGPDWLRPEIPAVTPLARAAAPQAAPAPEDVPFMSDLWFAGGIAPSGEYATSPLNVDQVVQAMIRTIATPESRGARYVKR